jgi:hypothetical protein
MHNRALHDTLAAFVEEAAWQLAEEVSGGAEVPFELEQQGRSSAPLYCYRPLTGAFISERAGVLSRLPSFPPAVQGLMAIGDLDDYLRACGRRGGRDLRADAEIAVTAFLTAVWENATDFVFDRARFDAAYAELEEAVYTGRALTTVLAPVDGLVIESPEVTLGDGLTLVRGDALRDAPVELRGDGYVTVAVLALEDASLEEAGKRLRRLQTALRLWDDAEPAIGPAAWARTGDGHGWTLVALATGIRRANEDCLLAAEEEDPLRAFCSLIGRRTPRGGELAWALRRFELGCERPSALESLTDWLQAARGLLGEERWAGRLAAICAGADTRDRLARRLGELPELERTIMRGHLHPGNEAVHAAVELGGHLRAVLRDVLCGHLDPDLRRLADELAAAGSEQPTLS